VSEKLIRLLNLTRYYLLIICYYLLIIIILLRAVLYSWVIMLRLTSISNDPGYKQTTTTTTDQT